jgi:membrane fusion protein, multidrug efflux system
MGKLTSAVHRHPRLAKSLAVVGGLLLVVVILAGVKGAQIGTLMAMGKQMEKAGPPPEAVGTAAAQSQTWERTLSAVGSISSLKSVAVSNEVPGIVSRIRFESGQMAKEGQVLVELDADVERAQLASAKARVDLAVTNEKRSKVLADGNAIARSQLDQVEAELETARTQFEAVKAQVDRKTVRAPFKGRLGIRAVNAGQYLSPGTTVTTLDSVGASYVDFTLPQEELPNVSVGMPVRVTIGDRKSGAGAGREVEDMSGKIAAIDPTIDPATRSLRFRATVPELKFDPPPGLFVNVQVVLPKKAAVVVVPATAIVHASYGDSVFVIEPKKPGSPGMDKTPDGKTVKIARQQFVRVGQARGDFVAVAKGLTAGQEVVTAGGFKLRNNVPVVVDNSIKPNPQLDPRPENR